MSQRVQVAFRLRPQNDVEKRVGGALAAEQESDSIVILGDKPRRHTFDQCFGSPATQKEIFDQLGVSTVKNVLKGYNGTVLAYGQTGSGKTHTMLGPGGGAAECLEPNSATFADRGLIPRMIEFLFESLSAIDPSEVTWSVGVSVFELYKEQLHDLLSDSPREPSEYRIREDIAGGCGIYVEHLYEKSCTSATEVLRAIQVGASKRKVASTQANDTSSRSHSITLLLLRQTNHLMGGTVTQSKLTLVDLAGSEKVGKTLAAGERLKEAQSINLSLTLLGNVIYKLTDGKSAYIPYRDSKLTRLLQESLGGNSCTILLCCASPSQYNREETISTIAFAARAKQITNKPRINRDFSEAELRTALAKALEEIADLKDRIALQEEFIQRNQLRGTVSPARAASHLCTDETAITTLNDCTEVTEDLQTIIDRLMRENSELRAELQELRSRNATLEVQVDFHKERSSKAEEKVAELTSRLKREESLFERRLEELKSNNCVDAVPFFAVPQPLPAEKPLQEVHVSTRNNMRRFTGGRPTSRSKLPSDSVPIRKTPIIEKTENQKGLISEPLQETQSSQTELLLRIEQLNAECNRLRQDLSVSKMNETTLMTRIVSLTEKSEALSMEKDESLRQLEETKHSLSESERRCADMKRILDALNIDVEEQLQLERERAAIASSEAIMLRGKNTELLEAQSQQEFCDLAAAELIFKSEDMEAIENEVVAIRFSRLPSDSEIEALRDSCLSTLRQLDSFVHSLLERISDRRFATANLETCRLNIIADALALQDRAALATKRLGRN